MGMQLATGRLEHARLDASRFGDRPMPEPLTRAEQEVADLVAAGLRNAEVGTRLFITQRTVECHLTRIYQKLGVRSRTELAIALAPDFAPQSAVQECWRCHAQLGTAATVA